MRRALFFVVVWLMVPGGGQAFADGLGQVFDRDLVIVETATGHHGLRVELARTPEQRRVGLMYRRALAPNHGMLFDFGEVAPIYMWMANTYISLDMVFLDGEGGVIAVAANTTPLSHDIIRSPVPARGVLELLAGTAARLGIAPGDRVRNSLFGGVNHSTNRAKE